MILSIVIHCPLHNFYHILYLISFFATTEDILLFLEQQVDTTTQLKLCVDREELVDRAFLQWRRKKMATPASTLKVVYIGEAGIDTGALRKEFLTGEFLNSLS